MPSHNYVSLKVLLNASEREYLNIFGVISKLQAQGVHVRDESQDSIRLELSPKCDQLINLIKTGDILRVHRLHVVSSKTYLISKASDVVVFPSFMDQDSLNFEYKTTAENPTLERSHFDRVNQLEMWLSKDLLQASFCSIKTTGWTNIVFRIADIVSSSARCVLIVHDGTKPNLPLHWMLSSDHEHSDDYILEHLVTISVWDRHAQKASKFNKGDLAVIFNLEISKGKGSGFELHLRGGTHHGKCLRKVHPNSVLGRMFEQSRPARSKSSHRVRAASTSVNPVAESSTSLSNMRESSSRDRSKSPNRANQEETMEASNEVAQFLNIPTTKSVYHSNRANLSTKFLRASSSSRESSPTFVNKGAKKQKLDEKISFPVFVDIPIPKHLLSLSEYTKKDTDEVCCVKAHVTNIIPANPKKRDDIKNYIKCCCATCKYDRSIIPEQYKEFVKSSAMFCQICSAAGKLQQPLIPYFYATFILSDQKSRLRAILSGYYFDILLGISADDVLSSEEEQRKVLEFFRQVYPSMFTDGKTTDKKRSVTTSDFKWIVDRRSTGKNKQEHRIISVAHLDEAS